MSEHERRARSFGGVAEAYDRGRPTYPDDAVRWLVGEQPATVLELGAGTGKLTERLVALGHDVHATEPDEAMLAVLRRRLPGVRASAAGAEQIPAADASVDVVVGAQCFHWFDHAVALPEIARVLRPGGHLALVWNQRDERIPWVRKLGRIIGSQDNTDSTPALEASEEFLDVDTAAFAHWQTVDRRSIQDLARSRSNLAVLDDEARDERLAELLALYDDYGRGMDGMQLPYAAQCFRAEVAPRRQPEPEPEPVPEPEPTVAMERELDDSADRLPRVAAGLEDTGTLLIDFR
ncbi:class I SAM-dependent methyltransferase [Nocardioides marinquilinus]|uniref:Class I SAM-dependent methyltransferase n=1 Tax=Nocardioides marinquilinus TaxID=1210400 RepID=A0ABP9P512_9ACTN